jgi:mono/diheme cytochrome c family protein
VKKALFFLLLAAPAAAVPRIEFKETRHDFGVLTQGATVQHSFLFKNTGNEPLEIQSVNTSCGCTAALASQGKIPAHGEGRIDATYDSHGKLGDVDKQIRVWTNDPAMPMTVLTIAGVVSPSSHPEMTGTRNLFEGSCRSCHADRAAGKKGEPLFTTTCAMCHEHQRRGGKFIAPLPEDMAALSERELTRVIRDGKAGVSMPGFSREKGGPLDKKQIKSLVEFIKNLKEK